LKKNIKAKAWILFGRSHSQWKNSRVSDKAFLEVFQAQHISKVIIDIYMKNTISLPTPKRRQDSRETNIQLEWSKHVSS
jgi:hypothetical protein